jgi:hypothetical protein
MSYRDGMAAINLEMPRRIPRTEYSAQMHWKLIEAVTGIHVGPTSSNEERQVASEAFVKAWNYDFMWNILINGEIFGDMRTRMGHAVYAAGGTDYDAKVVCPFTTPEEVLKFDPWEAYGRIDKQQAVSDFNKDYQNNRRMWPECVNMTGIYITCVSGLIDIFGWDMMLLAAGTDPAAFGDLTNRYASWIQQYFDALAESAAPIVMVHDDIVWSSGAFISPKWYRDYVFSNYRKYFAPLHDAKKKIIYTSDGNYTEFIDDIAGTGVNGFVLEPLTDMEYVAGKYGRTHVIVGNADTRILEYGTKQEIRAEVQRCMEIGKKCPGFFLAVGNHIPSSVPVENAMYYNECYEGLARKLRG